MKKGRAKQECVSLWWADLVCQPGAIQRLSPYSSPRWKSLWIEVNTESTSQLLTIGKTDSTEKINLLQETDKKIKLHHPSFFLFSITTSVLQSQFLYILSIIPGMVKGGMASFMSCSMEICSNRILSISSLIICSTVVSFPVFRRISCLLPKAPPLYPPPPPLPAPSSPALIAH